MSAFDPRRAQRSAPDAVLAEIANFASSPPPVSALALETARYCLMDTLACGLMALKVPACARLIAPVVPGAVMPGGSRVPGTSLELDPVQGAFAIGAMVRWLDFNDTWLAAEWGQPSDNRGAILLRADYPSRPAVVAAMLGGAQAQISNALSNAWADGAALRTYRHAPNTGSRKSWAAGDATSRAVRLALMALKCEMGYPSALSAKTWGFQDVLFKGKALSLPQPFGSYVMENVLFKISYPAEFHAQTAVAAAMTLHGEIASKIGEIERITIETQEPGVRIIDKTGPLANPADRDHCIQYMVAIPLLFGRLTAADYEDQIANDPRVDVLRGKMQVKENSTFTQEYYDPNKRYIGNAVQVFFKDGTASERVQVDFPIGHRKRREEGMPVLVKKFEASVAAHFKPKQTESIQAMFADRGALAAMPVSEFVAKLVTAS